MGYDAHNYKHKLEQVTEKIRIDPAIPERNKNVIGSRKDIGNSFLMLPTVRTS